jgi:hypothetical protein
MKKTTKTTMKRGQHATYEYMIQTVKRNIAGRWVWVPRIKRLSWKRLAEIYFDDRTTNDVKEMIEREARRCGYSPKTILTLNR